MSAIYFRKEIKQNKQAAHGSDWNLSWDCPILGSFQLLDPLYTSLILCSFQILHGPFSDQTFMVRLFLGLESETTFSIIKLF